MLRIGASRFFILRKDYGIHSLRSYVTAVIHHDKVKHFLTSRNEAVTEKREDKSVFRPKCTLFFTFLTYKQTDAHQNDEEKDVKSGKLDNISERVSGLILGIFLKGDEAGE